MNNLNQIYEKSHIIAKALLVCETDKAREAFLLQFFNNEKTEEIIGHMAYLDLRGLVEKINMELFLPDDIY